MSWSRNACGSNLACRAGRWSQVSAVTIRRGDGAHVGLLNALALEKKEIRALIGTTRRTRGGRPLTCLFLTP